jgi:hypothetical protein
MPPERDQGGGDQAIGEEAIREQAIREQAIRDRAVKNQVNKNLAQVQYLRKIIEVDMDDIAVSDRNVILEECLRNTHQDIFTRPVSGRIRARAAIHDIRPTVAAVEAFRVC